MRRLSFVFALAVALVLGTATVAAADGLIKDPGDGPSGNVGLPPGCLGVIVGTLKSSDRVPNKLLQDLCGTEVPGKELARTGEDMVISVTSLFYRWLTTPSGYAWLDTPTGQLWFQSPAGQSWLETPDGQEWSNSPVVQ